MTNEIITQAIDMIDQTLKSSSKSYLNLKDSALIDTRDDLSRLLELDSSKTDWVRLFCRQLKRLMNYKRASVENFWLAVHNDVLCILHHSNDQQTQSHSWLNFVKRMKLEAKLEQRQIEFQQTFGERKSLNELLFKHEEVYKKYLNKCILFHSKIQVQGLVENIDDLVEFYLTSETRNNLEKKLKCIEIPIKCSNQSLNNLSPLFPQYDRSNESINTTFSNFQPSTEQLQFRQISGVERIEHILLSDRWIVILGDPGSAKTTVLRQIMHTCANETRQWIEKLERRIDGSIRFVRIPILLRIGEFVQWLEEHPTKTLLDYIGKHTWLAKSYCDENEDIALKELVYHGHALILVDGLDEISDVAYRGKIVDLVRTFIDEYARTSTFLSAFDNEISHIEDSYHLNGTIFDLEYAGQSLGNQIIMTSRIVGYQFNSLRDGMIFHCSLSSMDNIKAKEFAYLWMSQVENEVLNIVQREISGMFRERLKASSEKRFHAIDMIFKNHFQSLKLNPLLLSLICVSIFRSSRQFTCQSRIEIYHHVIQSTFISWDRQKSNISKDMLIHFLVDLAFYLHVKSSSGLIDTFDMENVCCLTLKQYFPSANRQKLHSYSKELISSLDSDVGILVERGLQVFAFLHLTFQEYFVSQSFLRESSIESIAKRILFVVTNPRFREPILFVLGWISWKWSIDNYEQFCQFLVSSTELYAIPFGTLIFFDALDQLQKLPSNQLLCTALDSLFDHPSSLFVATYFIPNLIQLKEDVIIEWIQLRLQNENSFFKFCEYLLKNIFKSKEKINDKDSSIISRIICKQILLLHTDNPTAQLILDQTLRRIASSNQLSMDMCQVENSSLTSSDNIHPLILSIIIAVCGGLYLENDKEIRFSIKKIHRYSCILAPIRNYLSNENQIHSIKIQILIKQYEESLKNSCVSNISVDIIDTFIALICLQGLSQVSIYEKYQSYQAFRFAIERFQEVWFSLKTLFSSDRHDVSLNLSTIESVIKEFLVQSDQSNEQCLAFSLSCASAWRKLQIGSTSDWLRLDIFHEKNFGQYLECQPEFSHEIIDRKIQQMTENIHPLQRFQDTPFFLLTFLPQSLQPLYSYVISNSIDSSCMILLLSHCLTYLDTISRYNANFYLAILLLMPMLKNMMLENYGLILFEKCKSIRLPNKDCIQFFQAMKDRIDFDQPNDWQILIDIERQRINEAKTMQDNDQKDLRLFTGSICLARLLTKEKFSSDRNEEEIYLTIRIIINPILKLIALTIILNMKDPCIFNEDKRNELKIEIIDLFKSLLPNLSLSMSILLFIRCQMICPQMIDFISEKINESCFNEQIEECEAVFVALQPLDNSILSPYLFQLFKKIKNLSNLCQFYSTIYLEYYLRQTKFDSSNLILLSSMYLTELAFDVQILKLYKCDILPSSQSWNTLFKCEKKMSYLVAVWIENHLQILTKKELNQIQKDLSFCIEIEKKALPIIEKWIVYRMNMDLNFFAYYAVLQMIKEGLHISDLTNLIRELIDFDKEFKLKHFLYKLFTFPPKDSSIIREILILLHKNVPYFEQIELWISCQEVLEIIFNLEFERSDRNSRPYLLMIVGCSKDLEFYIKQYLVQSINEEHIATIIKWIIQLSIVIAYKSTRPTEFSIEFYQWILTFIPNQQYPLIERAILTGLNAIFTAGFTHRGCFFKQNQTIVHLEQMILNSKEYCEDVLVICLLTYGNYLLQCQSSNQTQNLSEQVQNRLLDIFKTSTSQIVSIRAGLCCIFSHYSTLRYETILHWFDNHQSLTYQRRYNLILQLTLYENWKSLVTKDIEILLQFINRFIPEFYCYLSKKQNINYLADPMPNYVSLALEICKSNLDRFRNAIETSTFDEKMFGEESVSYFYQTNHPSDRKMVLEFYTVFVGINKDLLDMFEWLESVQLDDAWNYLEHIKQIHDRDTIERLLSCLDSALNDIESLSVQSIFELIVRLVQNDTISLFEVHQHLLPMSNHFSSQISFTDRAVLQSLLNLSCIETRSLSDSRETLFTESGIRDKFHRVIQKLIEDSALYLRRNYFFINFRSIANRL